jgi:hypothetical protein
MVTLDEFISEIETTFSNYAETNDLDKISIKGWVITCLRKFGKNITEKRETVLDVKNSKVLLPEGFKSLQLALKVYPEGYNICGDEKKVRDSFLYKQYIENPVVWDTISQEYITNNCETTFITEKIFINNDSIDLYYRPEWLSIVEGVQKDTLDVDCLNLHPSIRGKYPHQISITNRTLNANFNEGKIYLQYNSLPVDEDGEVIIPQYTTGDIYNFIENYVKVRIAENLIVNSKNPQGLMQLLPMWKQDERRLFIEAKSEANYKGLGPGNEWAIKMNKSRKREFSRFSLPKF